jgi:hypothetical protein
MRLVERHVRQNKPIPVGAIRQIWGAAEYFPRIFTNGHESEKMGEIRVDSWKMVLLTR